MRTPNITEDDDVLDYSQTMRIKLIDSLMRDGNITDELDEKSLMVKTLADLSDVAMKKKKLGAFVRQNELDRQASLFVSTVLKQTGNRSPFEADEVKPSKIPELPDGMLEQFDISDTELQQGLNTERYEDFTQRMEPIMEAQREKEESWLLSQKKA